MIAISAQRYNNLFRTSQNLGYLLACIGEEVTIETDFYFEDITYVTTDNAITLKPDAHDVDLTDTTGIIYSEDGIAFRDYQVGDSVGVLDTTVFTYYTITEKLTDGMIRTSYSGAKRNLPTNDYVFNGTPMAGVRYAWNLIESGQDFLSKIDGELQQTQIATASATNTLYQTMIFNGLLSYQIGSVQVKGIAGSGGGASGDSQQSFTIKHTTVITPLFLSDQYNDLVLFNKPTYFKSGDCLHYVSRIDIGRNLSNPNGFQTLNIPYKLSNIGWFNETFNGGLTNYSVSSLVIQDGSDTIDSLRFGKDITVTINLVNSATSPFSNGNTKYIFGLNYLPENETFYQNNGENQTTNFLIDYKLNTLGSGSANGGNFGTDMQIIKSVTSTYVDTSHATITATINVGADAEDILRQGDFSRYQMWVIIENHSLGAALSDKVNLLAQVSEFDKELTTIDLIDLTQSFVQHPYEETDTSYLVGSGLEMFPVDDVVAYSKFSIDFTGRTLEGILINKIYCKLLLRHATESDIVLDEFVLNSEGYPLVSGLVQNIDFTQNRVFKIPNEIRKTIEIRRNYALDAGNVYNWEILYPFMNRWEYWTALAIDNPSLGIFDNTEPLDGLNHFWNRLANVSGWQLTYQVKFEIQQNGQEFEQEFETILDSFDFDSGSEWGAGSIKTYDGATELVNAGTKFAYGYQDVTVRATFEKIDGFLPDAADVEIVIWVETFENGGITGIKRFSSLYEDTDTWFKSSTNKVVVTKSTSFYTGTATLDYTKLPIGTDQITIYARVYDLYSGCMDNNLQDEEEYCLIDEEGNNLIEE